VKGQITLSLESTSARLYRLASSALHEEPFMPLDEILSRIDAVSAEQVLEAASRYYDPEKQRILRLGPS
jgi:predicted Zn-dependent peptidase